MADLRGPIYDPKFSQFHATFWKIWQNHMLALPGGLAPPPAGNPGSASEFDARQSPVLPFFNLKPNEISISLYLFCSPLCPLCTLGKKIVTWQTKQSHLCSVCQVTFSTNCYITTETKFSFTSFYHWADGDICFWFHIVFPDYTFGAQFAKCKMFAK